MHEVFTALESFNVIVYCLRYEPYVDQLCINSSSLKFNHYIFPVSDCVHLRTVAVLAFWVICNVDIRSIHSYNWHWCDCRRLQNIVANALKKRLTELRLVLIRVMFAYGLPVLNLLQCTGVGVFHHRWSVSQSADDQRRKYLFINLCKAVNERRWIMCYLFAGYSTRRRPLKHRLLQALRHPTSSGGQEKSRVPKTGGPLIALIP